jgi:hypothetical protein
VQHVATSFAPSSVTDMAGRNLGGSFSEVRLLTSYAPSSVVDMARRNLGWSFSEVRLLTPGALGGVVVGREAIVGSRQGACG